MRCAAHDRQLLPDARSRSSLTSSPTASSGVPGTSSNARSIESVPTSAMARMRGVRTPTSRACSETRASCSTAAQRRERPLVADVLQPQVAVERNSRSAERSAGLRTFTRQALVVVGGEEHARPPRASSGAGSSSTDEIPFVARLAATAASSRVLIGTTEGEQDRDADRRTDREREEDLGRELHREEQAERDVARASRTAPARRHRWLTNGASTTNDAVERRDRRGSQRAAEVHAGARGELVRDRSTACPVEPRDRDSTSVLATMFATTR